MKYALISEEQIKNLKGLISVLIRLGHPYNAGLCAEILESLKPSDPVAWFDWDAGRALWVQVYPNTHGQPLYALDEVTK